MLLFLSNYFRGFSVEAVIAIFVTLAIFSAIAAFVKVSFLLAVFFIKIFFWLILAAIVWSVCFGTGSGGGGGGGWTGPERKKCAPPTRMTMYGYCRYDAKLDTHWNTPKAKQEATVQKSLDKPKVVPPKAETRRPDYKPKVVPPKAEAPRPDYKPKVVPPKAETRRPDYKPKVQPKEQTINHAEAERQSENEKFVIEVDRFEDMSEARSLVLRLQRKGYFARVTFRYIRQERTLFFYVRVLGFLDQDAAKRNLETLKSNFGSAKIIKVTAYGISIGLFRGENQAYRGLAAAINRGFLHASVDVHEDDEGNLIYQMYLPFKDKQSAESALPAFKRHFREASVISIQD